MSWPGQGWPAGLDGARLADGLARMLHRMITDDAARRRVRARFELALEATRRPELRAAYDEMGRWLEGTAFYALAGAGITAAPTLDVLRDQLTRLLAGLCGDDRGRR